MLEENARVGMPDLLEARRFLRALCNVKDGAPDPVLVFQIVDDRRTKDKPPRTHVTDICSGTVLERARKLTLLNQDGGAIFFQVGEGPRGSKLTAVRALCIDDDLKHSDRRPDFSRCPPSAIVHSSPVSNPGKLHAYWFLKEGEPIDQWLPAQQHLAKVHGTDPAVAERLSLCMRLPGFFHCKPGKPPERSKLIELHPERRYTIAEVMAAWPPDTGDLQNVNEMQRARLRLVRTLEPVERPTTDDKKHAAIDLALNGLALDKLDAADGVTGPEVQEVDDTAQLEGASLETFQKVIEWLDKRGRKYTLSPMHPRRIHLANCPLNRDHTDASIIIRNRGGIWAGCFHASCKANKQIWRDFKNAIGGWTGLERGDHPELAQQLLTDLREGSTEDLIYDEGALYRYEPEEGTWQPIPDAKMIQRVMLYSGRPHGPNNRPLKLKWSDATGISKFACKQATPTEPFFAAAPPGLLFANGFVDVHDGNVRLQEHAPEHRARVAYPFAYEPTADAPQWREYLWQIFDGDEDAEQKIAALQEFLGACLLGIAPRFQAAVFLTGEGGNGKSVLLNVFASLFPQHALTSVKPQDMEQEYYRAMLVNARLNVVSEVPERDILDTGPFKAIVVGDPTTGRPIREAPVTFRARAGHLFACNRLPLTADYTTGFWRRVLVVGFNRFFAADDTATVRDLDKIIVAAERAGVCNWGLVGAQRLLARGAYTMPASSELAKKLWQHSANPIAQFVEEAVQACEPKDGATTEQLYQAYRQWAGDNGHQPQAKVNFSLRLTALKIESMRRFITGNARRHWGLRLTSEYAHFADLS